MAKDYSEPAFPQLDYRTPDRVETSYPGMSLRDYFAAKALLGLLDEPQWSDSTPGMTARVLGIYHGLAPQDAYARAAYMFADAMIKARNA